MIGAALYLSRRSFANSIQRRLQRLRQPKYLVGFFVGLMYFYWLFFRPGGRDRTAESILPTNALAGETIAIAGLVVIVLFTWILGSAETPFTFQLAETDFLFTAPLTRRQVLQFRLVRSQLALLVSAVFSVVLFSRGHIHASLLLRVAALWLLYSTLQLHNAGAALVRASLTQQSVVGIRRKLLSLIVLVSLLGAFWLGLREAVPVVRAAWSHGFEEGATALSGALHRGALGIALWPFFAVTGPLVATDAAEFAERLPAALAIAAVLYLWVMRSTLGFEEAAVEHANRVARRIEAVRRGRGEVRVRPGGGGVARPLLRLSATGAPAGAIMWKNVTGAMREFRPRTLFMLAVFVVVLGFSLGGKRGAAGLVATLSIALTGIVVLFGPLALRYDLRRDLELLDVLKSWPVRARDLIAAEVLAPAVLIASVAWIGLLGAFFATLPDRALLPLALRVPFLFAALAAVPAVVLVLLLVQNAAVLLFPAWTTIGPDRATGFEAMGQRILVFVGTAFALVIAVLPATIVGSAFAILVHTLGAGTGWTVAVWSVIGSVVLVFECYLGAMLLGPVLERLEPSGLR
jgi:hypothetical protein